jgi:CBS domain containing-hemolysin-like protein
MGDLLECIFGEIPSASDIVEERELRKRIHETNRVDGGMSVDQFNREFKAQLPTNRSDTVAGLVLHKFGELPPEGAGVVLKGWEFTVTAVEKNRIREFKAERIKADNLQVAKSSADESATVTPAPQSDGPDVSEKESEPKVPQKKSEEG